MDQGAQKKQLIMVIVLGGVLCIILIFNGKIKTAIQSLRNKSSHSGGIVSPKVADSSEIDSSELKMIRDRMGQIKINPLKNENDLWEEVPDKLERDIFKYQAPKRAPKLKEYSDAENLKKAQAKIVLNLEATITGESPLCVINDQTLNIGEKISDYVVEEIQDGLVILKGSGKTISLRLK